MNLIAVDLGNTRAKFGFFSGGGRTYPLPESTFTDRPGGFDALTGWIAGLPLHDRESLLWMVARTGSFPWQEFEEKLTALRPGDRFEDLGWQDVPMPLNIDFPEKLGIDRLLAAFAALSWRKLPGNRTDNLRTLVVDAGSATTVDLINPEGVFSGGAIFPGLNALSESLASISPCLPRLRTDEISFAVYPGKNTEEALAAGIYWGTIGAIRQIHQLVTQTLRETGLPEKVPVFLAGGDAESLATGLSMFMDAALLVKQPELILSGIALTARYAGKF